MTTPDPEATARQESGAAVTTPRSGGRDVQFAPGTIIAGRYRISSILGSGGMGEVYRADDTKLDQTVALKFLPARLAREPILLSRLHDEVRLGRQIAHPNVCRIYDIVDADGAHFVSMEYVDGEDLSRLLRRIGRLAHDKAVDIARGIAAGLMAAHAKGILHRDLKPANVMVDSRGDARIMDFGLALGTGEDDGTISGTPAYMAPEQLAGTPATVQSDLYSLGLVMYELFTGKRALNARTMPERLREISSQITTPSDLIRDIDPAVERIILRCLANDPAQRPRSAREVIDALPGGDPLAAALAAGETPSPRIIAAAGAEGSLKPWQAWAMLGAVIALLTAMTIADAMNAVTRYTDVELAPAVLRQRATDILRTLGIPPEVKPVQEIYPNVSFTAWIAAKKDVAQWIAVKKGPGVFTYRLEFGPSPAASRLIPIGTNAPGWTTIEVDPHGRLSHLLVSPARPPRPKALDWGPTLREAGLEPASLRPVAPRDMPAAPFDARAAWSGVYLGDRTPLRIEAAAWQGTPVYFRITGPWDERDDLVQRLRFGSRQLDLFMFVVMVTILSLSLFLAWRNLRLRRGDRQGALRVAAAFFMLNSIAGILFHVADADVVTLTADLPRIFGRSANSALFLFILYVALEPFARRRWPEQLIAWARLIGGRPRDPLVGRHVLIGLIGGSAHTTINQVSELFEGVGPMEFGRRALTIPGSLGRVFSSAASVIWQGCLFMVILVLLTMLLRRKGLAAGALFLLAMAYFYLALGHLPELLPAFAAVAALQTFVTVRYGALAMGVAQGTFFAFVHLPFAPGAAWVTPITVIPFVAVLALAVWAFITSLGGQSPFNASLLDE